MPHKVSETEFRLLKVLWERGELTVREIAESLYAVDGESKVGAAEIGTVHSLLGRLEGKKLVRRSRRTHPHRFSAKVSIDEIAGGELEAVAEKLGDRSIAPFVMQLISNRKLTRDEADEIRGLLENYEPDHE
jgi:BlaI family transcriptional regulator, penicillinase repressor